MTTYSSLLCLRAFRKETLTYTHTHGLYGSRWDVRQQVPPPRRSGALVHPPVETLGDGGRHGRGPVLLHIRVYIYIFFF